MSVRQISIDRRRQVLFEERVECLIRYLNECDASEYEHNRLRVEENALFEWFRTQQMTLAPAHDVVLSRADLAKTEFLDSRFPGWMGYHETEHYHEVKRRRKLTVLEERHLQSDLDDLALHCQSHPDKTYHDPECLNDKGRLYVHIIGRLRLMALDEHLSSEQVRMLDSLNLGIISRTDVRGAEILKEVQDFVRINGPIPLRSADLRPNGKNLRQAVWSIMYYSNGNAAHAELQDKLHALGQPYRNRRAAEN